MFLSRFIVNKKTVHWKLEQRKTEWYFFRRSLFLRLPFLVRLTFLISEFFSLSQISIRSLRLLVCICAYYIIAITNTFSYWFAIDPLNLDHNRKYRMHTSHRRNSTINCCITERQVLTVFVSVAVAVISFIMVACVCAHFLHCEWYGFSQTEIVNSCDASRCSYWYAHHNGFYRWCMYRYLASCALYNVQLSHFSKFGAISTALHTQTLNALVMQCL